jgi:hypothetical protein
VVQVWCDGASGDVGTVVAFVTLRVERLSDWRLEMRFCVVSWAGLSRRQHAMCICWHALGSVLFVARLASTHITLTF